MTTYVPRELVSKLADGLQKTREAMDRGEFRDPRSLAKTVEALCTAAELSLRYILKDPDVK